MHVREAVLADVPAIHDLLEGYAARGNLLPRTRENVQKFVRDFLVAEEDGALLGAGALEIMGADLGEIRSLVVDETQHGRGIGRQISLALMDEARVLGLTRIMALTYVPKFFESLGFEVVEVDRLPEKVWQVCVNCYKFQKCDEIAMLRRL